MPEHSRALVLAGGGVAGIAWELGMIAGLAEAGIQLAAADLIVGTSAGSTVGAQLASGKPIEELLARQLDPESAELAVDVDLDELRATFAQLAADAPDLATGLARIGAMALETPTVSEAKRRDVIRARLPAHEWSRQALVVTAVDAQTGELLALDRDSGVPLVDAVAASCAVPGVWPPVSIAGRRYIDGGVASLTHADLARGHDRILVLVPLPLDDVARARLDAERATLGGPEVSRVLEADAASAAAIGVNPLDPATRPAAAWAGRSQAGSVADEIRGFWG